LLGADPCAGGGVRQVTAAGIDRELQPLARLDVELLHRSHGIGHGVSSVLVACHLPCQLTGIEDYSRLLRSVSGVLLMPLTWLLTSARLQAFVAESAAVVVELLHQCVQLPLLDRKSV